MNQNINQFFKSNAFGVVGASNNRSKFGNKVLRCYLQHQLPVYPVNPNERIIEGLSAFNQIADLPREVVSLSIITPPAITEQIVADAIAKGIKNIWMQPGAESQKAIEMAEKNNVNVIAGGPCILVQLGFQDE
jgi:predicted CoA-binding protein